MSLKDEGLSDSLGLRDAMYDSIMAGTSPRAQKRLKTAEDGDPCYSVIVVDPKSQAGYTAVEIRPEYQGGQVVLSIPTWLAEEFGHIGDNPDVDAECEGSIYDISGCTREEVVQFMIRIAEFYVAS